MFAFGDAGAAQGTAEGGGGQEGVKLLGKQGIGVDLGVGEGEGEGVVVGVVVKVDIVEIATQRQAKAATFLSDYQAEQGLMVGGEKGGAFFIVEHGCHGRLRHHLIDNF